MGVEVEGNKLIFFDETDFNTLGIDYLVTASDGELVGRYRGDGEAKKRFDFNCFYKELVIKRQEKRHLTLVVDNC